ncbi:MAG: hypothetical protein WCG04_04405 [Alphaproteobacteria bacterium]
MFGFSVNIFKKNISASELENLERLQRYLTLLMPEYLEEASSIHPIPGYIDWRYVQATNEPVVKLLRCITDCQKIATKSKPVLVELTSIINKYLAKPQSERSHAAELKFRTDISKVAPKIIQSWIDNIGFKCEKFWAHYLHYHIDPKH